MSYESGTINEGRHKIIFICLPSTLGVFKNSKIYHKEIFKAISQGKYIRVKEDNIINRDDSIDI